MSHEPVASAASAPSLQPEVGRTVIEPLPAPLRGAATVPGDKSISVSYTHLDVYKRQA